MYNVSETFLSKIKESSRTLDAKININGTDVLKVDIQNFSVEHNFGNNNMPTISGVTSAKLNVNFINSVNIPAVLIGVPIKPYVALETSTGVFEWVPLGVFYATTGDVKKTDKIITIECFDIISTFNNIIYVPEVTFPALVTDVIADIVTQFGISFKTQTLPAVTCEAMQETNLRQALSNISGLISTNCISNRLGEVEFRFLNTTTFALDGNNYHLNGFNLLSESQAKISQLIVDRGDGEDVYLVVGDSTGFAITMINEGVADSVALQTIFNRIYPLTYYPYNLKLQGMPHLEVGDTFSFTDIYSITRTLIMSYHKISYNGGLVSETKCESPREEVVSVGSSGTSSVGQAIARAQATLLEAVNSATGLITGQNGGVIVTNTDANGYPIEMLIMNTSDISTATHVWRWNINGLGYSSTGYLGPYTTAITADGQIVADFITTGTLTANIIKAGILKSANNTTWINMEDGSFSFGGGTIAITDNNITVDGEDLATWIDTKAEQSEVDEIKQYIDFDPTNGLIIGSPADSTKVNILNNQIRFIDDGNVVAWISSQKLYITSTEVTTSLIINSHEFKRYNDNITIVTFVG